jgi:hypothetical protein
MTPFTDTLCLECGLCCNGVLFADIRREPGDPSPLFAQHGPRVAQPCPAFNAADGRCAFYAGRPARCRKFECQQLLAVCAGKKTTEAAQRRVRAARKLAMEVGKLLAELGFNDVRLSLSRRFRRCQRAAENGGLERAQLDCLADLQVAVHKLNILLAGEFHV